MKLLALTIFTSVAALSGCASSDTGTRPGTASTEQSYVPLGSLIAKKGPKENKTMNMQELDNSRTMNNSGVTSSH